MRNQWLWIGLVGLVCSSLLVLLYDSTQRAARQAHRMKGLQMLYVALAEYSNDHNGFPPAHTTDTNGRPLQSWRVLLLPYLDGQSLYSQIDLAEAWDSSKNRKLLGHMPHYYRSPLETDKRSTETDYYAVLGSQSPWWSNGNIKPWEVADRNQILLIELPGLKKPWMAPRDPSLEELLDVLRPVGGSVPQDIMYVTVGGDMRIVDESVDRDGLKDLLLGR